MFWGGREGYETLLNTDLKLEMDNLARFLHMAVDYAKEIGFTGQFLIEPKPKEPTKHQYDFDVGTVIGFLKTYGWMSTSRSISRLTMPPWLGIPSSMNCVRPGSTACWAA